MEESRFDRLTRMLAGKQPRRGILALVAALAAFGPARARAQVAGCGAEGGACTMLLGCCAGLTCATSALNPSYGICVTGEGGLVTVGTSLMVPGSDEAVAQAAAMVTEFESAAPVDLQAERQAQLQERRAKQDTKDTRQKTQKDERRSKQRSRRSKRRERRRSDAESEGQGTATTTASSGVQVSVSCPQGGVPQLVTIRNTGSSTIDVAKVGSLLNPIDEEPFTPTDMMIDPGVTQQLQFGGADGDVPGAIWMINVPIFDASPLEGVRVELRTRSVFFACCDGTGLCYGQQPSTVTAIAEEKKRRRGHRRKKRRQVRSGKD